MEAKPIMIESIKKPNTHLVGLVRKHGSSFWYYCISLVQSAFKFIIYCSR